MAQRGSAATKGNKKMLDKKMSGKKMMRRVATRRLHLLANHFLANSIGDAGWTVWKSSRPAEKQNVSSTDITDQKKTKNSALLNPCHL